MDSVRQVIYARSQMSTLLKRLQRGPRRLRELLASSELIVAPGAYDCLSARLIETAGFPAVYMTGFGTAAAYLGRPDVGLLGMSEMVDHARRIVSAVDVPVIADADTGYGNAINVIRTVQAYEGAGVAALHIEDQLAPKKCGHMEGKQLIPAAEMVEKIRAAAAARSSSDFVVIARTDARAVEGLDAALDRAHRYREAGADLLFVEAPESESEIERVAASLHGVPLLFNWAEGGKTPPMPLPRLRELGFRVVIFPIGALLVAARAIRDLMATLAEHGTPAPAMDRMVTFREFIDFIGIGEVRALEQRFAGRQNSRG
jgi:carboxyvinyl-carboxyphosphonate phosphorylmutase